MDSNYLADIHEKKMTEVVYLSSKIKADIDIIS